MVVPLQAVAGAHLPLDRAGVHVDRGEIPLAEPPGFGLLGVGVEEPIGQRCLGHCRWCRHWGGPGGLAVAVVEVDAGDAGRGGLSEEGHERVGISVVVLHDHRATDCNQTVFGVAGVGAEDRHRTQLLAGVAIQEDHIHPWIGVVGDRDQIIIDQGRGGAGSLGELTRLDAGAAVVRRTPLHLGGAIRSLERDEVAVGDDEHRTGLVSGQRVEDLLAWEIDRVDRLGRWVDHTDPAALGGKPDLSRPVGHGGQGTVALGNRAIEVDAVALGHGVATDVDSPQLIGGR